VDVGCSVVEEGKDGLDGADSFILIYACVVAVFYSWFWYFIRPFGRVSWLLSQTRVYLVRESGSM